MWWYLFFYLPSRRVLTLVQVGFVIVFLILCSAWWRYGDDRYARAWQALTVTPPQEAVLPSPQEVVDSCARKAGVSARYCSGSIAMQGNVRAVGFCVWLLARRGVPLVSLQAHFDKKMVYVTGAIK